MEVLFKRLLSSVTSLVVSLVGNKLLILVVELVLGHLPMCFKLLFKLLFNKRLNALVKFCSPLGFGSLGHVTLNGNAISEHMLTLLFRLKL